MSFHLLDAAPPENFITWDLENGSDHDMNVDGSTTPVEFYFECPDNEISVLCCCNVLILDNTVKIDKFGGLDALANGLLIRVVDSDHATVKHDYTSHPITMNAEWVRMAGDHVNIQVGAGVDMCAVGWEIAEHGRPLRLKPGQRLVATVQDNLTGLVLFHMTVQGQRFSIAA